MIVNKFNTTGNFLTDQQLQNLPQYLAEFESYLKEKYTFISKMDMLKTEKETREYYHLSVSQAIKIWNNLYKY